MKDKVNFDDLYNVIKENQRYKLNTDGQRLLSEYHKTIGELQNSISNTLEKFTKDYQYIASTYAIHIISDINKSKKGNELFDIMVRLDIMTNGGKTNIDNYNIHQEDDIMKYIEKA